MSRVPETRASLIVRLPSAQDAAAWREFVAIYEPFVFRFARRHGLQEADAAELVQNVLLAVIKAVGRWQSDPRRARFRSWLFTIARNQLLDLLAKKGRQPVRSGSSSVIEKLNNLPAADELESRLILEHRRELFRWAAARVKETVTEQTWQAFRLTGVENMPVEDAAKQLGMSVGAVYIARSRVIARLRQEVAQLEGDDAL